jgi:hypothetical protein
VEYWRILLDQEIGHLPGAIFGLFHSPEQSGWWVSLWHIMKDAFLTRERIDQGREEGFHGMRDVKCQSLDVVTDSFECSHTCWACESTGFESDGKILEKKGRRPHAKVVTNQAHIWKVLLLYGGENCIATILGQPKSQESRTGGQDKVADGAIQLRR